VGVASPVALMSRLPRYFGSADVADILVAGVGPVRGVGTNVTVVMGMAVNTAATVDAVSVMVGRRGSRLSGCM